MSDADAVPPPDSPRPAQPPVSPARLFKLLIPVVIIAVGAAMVVSVYWESAAREKLEATMLSRLAGQQADEPASDGPSTYDDKDGDLVADCPDDAADCIAPDELTFSYVAAVEDRDQATIWKEVLDAISQATDRPVKYVHFTEIDAQLEALRSGQLHIAGLNTGSVPAAVNTGGFVPLCTFGNAEGEYGYTMKIIVPAGSEITKVEDLKQKKITFTRPNSNSGFKAAFVLLMDDYDMLPERDYEWTFSYGHEASIRGVAAEEYVAAPTASDILDRMISQQEVSADAVRSIYESERFPPAALGYVYNLAPDLRQAIQSTLLEFDWSGTGLEEEFGEQGQFVTISYKDDWANTRRIDQTLRKARTVKPRP